MPVVKLFNLNQPLSSLLAVFVTWKLCLVILAIASPGPGYDTSTSLLLDAKNGTDSSGVKRIVGEKLTRWDGIYFVKVADRGYLFEQEWAFGWGWTGLISLITTGLREVGIGRNGDLLMGSLVGIFIAHLSHGLSVLVLYQLTDSVFAHLQPRHSKKLAFISACLHVFSPAGLFLSAPFTESTFSFLSFTGYYLFVRSLEDSASRSTRKDINLILAGLLFGFSVTIRSNGILNGILFLQEAVRALLSLKPYRLLAAGLGGALVGAGFVLPQIIAYQQFCMSIDEVGSKREWCMSVAPSIYRFVQSHYWNVGFLRYWTLSNIPLFLLGTPMFSILTLSSIWGIKNFQSSSSESGTKEQAQMIGNTFTSPSTHAARVIRTMAVIQGILGVTTLLNAHVQIITRMASGYPVWYWWLASKIIDTAFFDRGERAQKKTSEWVVRWMVVYAVVQGGLFVGFLPPA